MNNRAAILNKIKNVDQQKVEINSHINAVVKERFDLLSVMSEKLLSIGAEVIVFDTMAEVEKYVTAHLAITGSLVNAIENTTTFNIEKFLFANATERSSLKKFITKGSIGVAESGAIWVKEKNMNNRLLPFICEHLYLVLHEEELVFDLDEAYDRIGTITDGYGVFIAGPSKTADIEQSLVIGAHGPINLTVLFIKKEIALV